jgi:hypothetical protein
MATQREIVQSIIELVNPRTGTNFTELDAQRILRADFRRRVRATKYMAEYKKRKENGARKQNGAT